MKRLHYAWLICAGGTVMLFTSIGLGVNVFSVFQPHLMEYAGLTNTQASFITTTRSLFMLLGMMSAGALADKIGLRRICTLSILMLTAACALFALSDDLAVYCVAGALTGLSYCWGGVIPSTLLVNRWFQDRQALALGIISSGTGLATILAPTPITWIIETYSLSAAFWAQGIFVALLALLVWIVVRDGPEDLGMAPFTSDAGASGPVYQRSVPRDVTPLRWSLVLAAAFLIGGSTSLGISHFGVLYSTEGYSSAVVAGLVSCMGFCLMVGKIIYGQLVDRLGGHISNFISFGLVYIGYGLCCLAPNGNVGMAYAAMIFVGFGLPISNLAPSIWSKDLMSGPNFARSLKWCQTTYALSIFLFGPVPGILADLTGSYVLPYFLFLLMLILSLALVAWVYQVTGAGRKPTPVAGKQ